MESRHLCNKLWSVCIFLLFAASSFSSAAETSLQKPNHDDDQEDNSSTGRFLTSLIFPFFPQYQDIDLGANLNNLKSPNTVAFFVVRDAIAVSIIINLIELMLIKN